MAAAAVSPLSMRKVCATLVLNAVLLAEAAGAGLRGDSHRRLNTTEQIPGYQQLNIDNDGQIVGGACINFETARIDSVGTGGVIQEDIGVQGCKEKCQDEKGCVQFVVCVGSGGCTPGSCGLLKESCLQHPTDRNWDVYAVIPLEKCEEEIAQDQDASDFLCPIEFPIGQGKDAEVQEAYFTKLHCGFIHGNGYLAGAKDKSVGERLLKYYGKELKCIYALFLDDRQKGGPCGGLKSRFDDRQKIWESTCLDPRTSTKHAMDLMSDEEKKYYFARKKVLMDSQAFRTYVDLKGEKEILCMQMKLVDDTCGAFKSPRMLPPKAAAKLLKPRRKDVGKDGKDPMRKFSK